MSFRRYAYLTVPLAFMAMVLHIDMAEVLARIGLSLDEARRLAWDEPEAFRALLAAHLPASTQTKGES